MNQTVSILCDFFDKKIHDLDATYNWKTPVMEKFTHGGEGGYESNIEFKKYIKNLWDAASSESERLHLTKIIVKNWGGVGGNKDDTLKKYIEAISKNVPPTPLQGIASYSKIFSFADPQRFAIYDARVAACLNALQINAKVKNGLDFNYVPGRNNVVGNVNTHKGFTHEPRFSTKELVLSGWTSVKRDETYQKHLELLHLCLKERPKFNLTSLEMALFANAEIECKKARHPYARLL